MFQIAVKEETSTTHDLHGQYTVSDTGSSLHKTVFKGVGDQCDADGTCIKQKGELRKRNMQKQIQVIID